MRKVTLSLTDDVWVLFRIACLQRNTSASKVIDQLIRAQLERWHHENAERSDQ